MNKIKDQKKKIGVVLLEQRIFANNYIRAETLYRAKKRRKNYMDRSTN